MAGLFDFLNPIGNIAELVGKVISALFKQLAKVLMPDFLKNATVDTLKWLCSVPNPADARRWRNVAALSQNVTAIAWGLLPLPFMLAALRFWGQSLTGSGSPVIAVQRVTVAAFGLVIYPWGCQQAIALANVTTNALLSSPSVGHGLNRVTSVLFGHDIVTGLATPFLGLLALIAIVLGTLLFALKIALLLTLSILFAGGPLVLALYPLPETAHLFRLWMYVGIALLLIPIGWVLIFATAGALILDATDVHNLAGGAGNVIDQKTTAALAGLLAFALAVAWPKTLISQAIGRAGMFGVSGHGPSLGASQGHGGSAAPSRARMAMTSLRDGTSSGGGGGAGGSGGRAGRAAAAAALVGGGAGAVAGAGRASGASGAVPRPGAPATLGPSSDAAAASQHADRAGQVRSGGAAMRPPAPDAPEWTGGPTPVAPQVSGGSAPDAGVRPRAARADREPPTPSDAPEPPRPATARAPDRDTPPATPSRNRPRTPPAQHEQPPPSPRTPPVSPPPEDARRRDPGVVQPPQARPAPQPAERPRDAAPPKPRRRRRRKP